MKCKIVYKGKNPYSPFGGSCYYCETHNVSWETNHSSTECWMARQEKNKSSEEHK
jgi:hypothetical protein